MKKNYFTIAGLGITILFLMASCGDYLRPEFEVEKPESLEALEYLKDYDLLKSYIDRDANPSFKLGSGVSVSDYSEQGLVYGMISSNFDEVTAGYQMKHGALVQEDGSIDFTPVIDFIAAAEEAGVTIYGHTLCWHANQNAEYLNSTIAPTIIPGTGEPTLVEIASFDFEGGAGGWVGWGNESTRGLSADGEGYDGTGFAYTFTNPTVSDYWAAQVAFDLAPALTNGGTYTLNFQVKADGTGEIRPEVQSTADFSNDGFGVLSVTTEWQEYTLDVVVTAEDRNRFVISFGDYAGTILIDDLTLSYLDPEGSGEVVEMTPQEKKAIISDELERWISGMMAETKDYVTAWDVVNEPMDDGNPDELKTGIGKELNDDQFYWQDYLGKDYAVMAIEFAREYGNEGDLLFINDYNLEYNLDKCQGIIDYVEYVESKGVTVDGIGTQMHISTDSDKSKIEDMFTMLAATGKLIKVSELDIGVGEKTDDATDEHYIAQAEMYEFVVNKYFELVPAAQRYGITVWSPMDQPRGSNWRADEPIGLWTQTYQRKRAYGGFADGLMNN